MESLHTTDEVATLLKVSKERVLAWILAGDLRAIDLDGTGEYRIRFADLQSFLKQQNHRTTRALEKVKAKIEEETVVFENLYVWLQEENNELSKMYKKLDHCLLQVVDQFKMGWDSAQRAGERARAQAFQDALMEVYQRWEKPKQTYQQWLMDHEKRWQIFITQLGPFLETEAGLMAPADPFLAMNMASVSGLTEEDSLIGAKRRQKDVFQALYLWTKRENFSLTDHYRQMERSISRITDALQAMAKKASRSMEFERGLAFQEAATVVYREWETARAQYNHWLLGRHERWQVCHEKVKISLAKKKHEVPNDDAARDVPDAAEQPWPFWNTAGEGPDPE